MPSIKDSIFYESQRKCFANSHFRKFANLLITDEKVQEHFTRFWNRPKFRNPANWESFRDEQKDHYKWQAERLAALNRFFSALLALKTAFGITKTGHFFGLKGDLAEYLIYRKLEASHPGTCSYSQEAYGDAGTKIVFVEPWGASKPTSKSEIDIVQQTTIVSGRTIEVKSSYKFPMILDNAKTLFCQLQLGTLVHKEFGWGLKPTLASLGKNDDVLHLLDDLQDKCDSGEITQSFNQEEYDVVGWL